MARGLLVPSRMRKLFTMFVVALVIAACEGEVLPHEPDAPTDHDAGVDTAPSDAPPAARPFPGRDLAVATGRMTGGGWTVDIHLGSATSHAPTSGGSWTVRGGTPIDP